MRVAAFDCGTNSLRLLIADVSADGQVHEILREMQIVRLGYGVDATGQLDPAAIERTLAVTAEYKTLIESHGGVEAMRFVATSATRDASNRQVFVDGVREILGIEPDVLSGDEEAELSFAGATVAVAAQHPGPYLVVDLGGGSTEFVLGDVTPDGKRVIQAGISTNMGCVRMTERHGITGALEGEHRERVAQDVRGMIAQAREVVPFGQVRTLVGLAGSVTTITAEALALDSYDRERIDGSVLSVDEVLQAAEALMVASQDERMQRGFMHPGRRDVIAAGSLIWSSVVNDVAQALAEGAHSATVETSVGGELTIVTSERDILDGIALSLSR